MRLSTLKFKVMNRIKQWILYNVMSSFWVIYTPAYRGGRAQNKDMYLDIDGYWTEDYEEAKRHWKYQPTINRWTRSKKITL